MNKFGILLFAALLNFSWFGPGPASAQQTTLNSSSNPKLREALQLLIQGQAAQKAQQFQPAVMLHLKAISILEGELGPDDPEVANALNNLGNIYRTLDDSTKAFQTYQRSLAIREKSFGPEHPAVAQSVNNLAIVYTQTGQYQRALPLLQRNLAWREKTLSPEHPDLAQSLNNLAELYRQMADYAKALPLLIRSLAIREKALGPEHISVAQSLNNLGALYGHMGEHGKALPLLARGLAIQEKTVGPNHLDVARSLESLANLYARLNERAKALPLFHRSLAIREKVLGPDHPDVAIGLGNLALLYRSTTGYEKALPLYERSLAIRERSFGPEHPHVASSLSGIGGWHSFMGSYSTAISFYQRSLAIREKVLGADHRDVASNLNDMGILLSLMGDNAKALTLLQRALIVVSGTDPEGVWRTSTALRRVYAANGQPDLAIFFGKQAVNTLQNMRANLSQLELDLQRSFLINKIQVYRGLADLLIQQGRLAEAQHVLGMLKEEELFDFLRRSESDDPRQRRIAFHAREQPWHDRLSAITARAGKTASERMDLQRRARLGVTDVEKTRLAQLDREKETLDAELRQFYVEVVQAFRGAKSQDTSTPDAVAQVKATQQTLSSLGTGSVLVQYVLSENRLNVILTSATTQIAKSTTIAEKDLNQKIDFFRVGLRNPSVSVLPLAQELYKLLILPIEEELAAGNARTLMLSLDGALRYIPVSALHDGKQYLIERYNLSVYTEVTKDNLNVRPGKDMSIAGLGLTRPIEEFSALPAVRTELSSIVRNGNQGLIKGELHFDEQFNVANIKQALKNGHPLMHLASHFVFRPGNESTSFLLLGDGDRLTLSRIRQEKLDFSHVDLVTLSACETGVGGTSTAQGEEVEGLGALVQKQGAKGVIATLWPVADDSTGLLMQHFYRLREANKLSKAEALKQAQLMLIKGQISRGPASAQRGLDAPAAASATPASSYAHPYYWAPFILMGNWL